MIEFKALEADDVEVRVQAVRNNGCSLLLYKDARVDMRLLDEAVGSENWDCSYERIGNSLFCTVGILCQTASGNMTWVYKQDVGTKSNMEPEKGEASDAFKRACFKWGLGRELYTAPFIWVDEGILQKHEYDGSKWVCRDRFHVERVKIENGRITDLAIANEHGFTVYDMRSKARKAAKPSNVAPKGKTAPQNAPGRFDKVKALKAEAVGLGINGDGIDSWISETFNKQKKELTDSDIKLVEAYIANLIRDKKELVDG